jgi:hypothetical protein
VNDEPLGSRKRGQDEGLESPSPKKVRMEIPQTDQDGHTAYRISREQWFSGSRVPGVPNKGSQQPNTKELLEDMVWVGEEQIGLLREAVELLKELKGGMRRFNKALSVQRVVWEEPDEQEEGEDP